MLVAHEETFGPLAPIFAFDTEAQAIAQANDTEFEAGNFGTPGADSDCRPIVVGQCNDGGTLRDAVTSANTHASAPASTCVAGDGSNDHRKVEFRHQLKLLVTSEAAKAFTLSR